MKKTILIISMALLLISTAAAKTYYIPITKTNNITNNESLWENVSGEIVTDKNVSINGNLEVSGANTYLSNLYLDGSLYGDLGILTVGDTINMDGNDIYGMDDITGDKFNTNQVCISGDCKTAWPSGFSNGSNIRVNDLYQEGTLNLSGRIYYKNTSSPHTRLIDITYGKSASVASPFYYDVGTDPTDTATTNRIVTVVQAKINSPTDKSGRDSVYGNYVFAGETTSHPENGSKILIWDYYKVSLPNMAYPVVDVPSNNLEVGHHYVELAHPLDLSFGNSGSQKQYGGYTKYSVKANNVFGGSRTYETTGYIAEGFSGCQTYDTCYGFYAKNSDSLFDGSVILTSGDKVCLDGATCAFYLQYNGTCIYSSGSGNCV
jgi:hypothetical protein